MQKPYLNIFRFHARNHMELSQAQCFLGKENNQATVNTVLYDADVIFVLDNAEFSSALSRTALSRPEQSKNLATLLSYWVPTDHKCTVIGIII